MSSDQTVTARDVLRALADVRRRGTRPALEELEQLEPDLAEFLIEEVTAIHHDVLATGARAGRVRALTRRVEQLVVVLVGSLRQAHHRLWADGPDALELPGRIDPAPPGDPPAPGDAPEEP
jgi:hypothetical protein